MAVAALKRTALKQPIKTISKEVIKVIPFLGSAVGATVSVALLEATGWALANDMERKFKA